MLKHVGRQMVAQRLGLDHRLEHRRRARRLRRARLVHGGQGRRHVDGALVRGRGRTRRRARERDRAELRLDRAADESGSTTPQARSTIESLHILPVPTPEQIAPFVVYLASDESAAVTGTVFPVDAGYMAFKAQVDVMGTMQAGY